MYNFLSYNGIITNYTNDIELSYCIFIIISSILIIYLCIMLYKSIKYKGENYYQRKSHLHFGNINGEEFGEDAKLTIEFGEAIPNPNTIDHYRLGTTYLINARNMDRAYDHFNRALENIIEQKVDVRQAAFVLDRINEYKDRFIEYPDNKNLPLQEALLAQFNIINNNTKKVKESINPGDPNFKQKVMLSRQSWQSDSQNVHDSSIYTELNRQLSIVMEENGKIQDVKFRTYDELVEWYRNYFKDDIRKLEKVNRTFDILDNNYPVRMLNNIREQDIIVNVWRRAHDERNKDNYNSIRNALGDSILDCFESYSVVCMSGRISKIWQALAKLDVYDNIGILKSKQLLRNEIYERCAKIIDDYVGENGSVSKQLKESYNNSEDTEQVKELINCIHNDIDNLKSQYLGLMDDHQIDMILLECKSVI